jgi:hypothetical protein
MNDKIAVFDSPSMVPTLKSLNGRPLIDSTAQMHAFVLLSGSKVMSVTCFEPGYKDMTDDEIDIHIAAVVKYYANR